MSGKGKSKGKAVASKIKSKSTKAKSVVPRQSKSKSADITFPVGRLQRMMKNDHLAKRIGVGSAVYLAAVLEYLVAETLELAGNAARDNKRKRITPRHLLLSIKSDDELAALTKGVIFSEGGVLPFVHPKLLQVAKSKSQGTKQGSSQDNSQD